jgi:hypothetical protein
VRMLFPPGRDARLAPIPSAASEERNRNIDSIREFGRRDMRSRTFAGQGVEVQRPLFLSPHAFADSAVDSAWRYQPQP